MLKLNKKQRKDSQKKSVPGRRFQYTGCDVFRKLYEITNGESMLVPVHNYLSSRPYLSLSSVVQSANK